MDLPDIRDLGNLINDDDTLDRLRSYLEDSRSENTWKAYRSDMECYLRWCEEHNLEPLPCSAQQLCLYAESLLERGLKTSTVRRRVASLTVTHKANDCELPLTSDLWRTAWRSMCRKKGTSTKSARPIWLHDLVTMVRATRPNNLRGIRDRALLLVGWASGMKRSEIIGLYVEDCAWRPQGVALTIDQSKTGQKGDGRLVPLFHGVDSSMCPVRALRSWIDEADIKDGPVFRSISPSVEPLDDPLHPSTVSRIVQSAARRAGLNPKLFCSHSLRTGFCKSARAGGASQQSIMRITGHRSAEMVSTPLSIDELFSENPAGKAGL